MTHADVLVIGSGMAGLTFALETAQERDVLVVTKKDRPESNTNYAQGGIAAVFAADDSFSLHQADTFVAGAGLCHPDAVRMLVEEGPGRVQQLMGLGVSFSREGSELSLGREGGHSRRRIVRADDLTGRVVERALLAAVAAHPRIEVREEHAAIDLIVAEGGGRCVGAWVLDARHRVVEIRARATLLATGGSGQVYRHTTNPRIASGDGVAMAFRAGAAVANMEFIQFHPTALYPADAHAFLISEAVRGEGAVLCRRDGTEFMSGYHPLGSLAPRDVVARAIAREMSSTGDPYVLLDCSGVDEDQIRARFPNILAETRRRGLDMLRTPLPVVPAAHYQCGGVLTDVDGRTSLAGLFAAGETACTGVHGANRLASNSLLEALVFAHRAAAAVRTGSAAPPVAASSPAPESEPPPAEGARVDSLRKDLQAMMWEKAGIVRSDAQLADAAATIARMAADLGGPTATACAEALELRNLLDVARLIVRGAMLRRESRGLHFNTDHPYRDNERFLCDTRITL